jgi:hypothetical protein
MKHLTTLKHKKVLMKTCGNIKVADVVKIKSKKNYNCVECNRYYKSRSGCYKHERKCMNKISQLEQRIADLKKQVDTKYGGDTTINNNITIQLFLDKQCGNAISLEGFVKNIRLSMDEIFQSNQIGLSSLIVKQLQKLDYTERPIHCSDVDNLNFYIKSEKEWKNDNGKMVEMAVETVKKGVNGTVSKYMETDNMNEDEQLQILEIIQTINNSSHNNSIIKIIGNSVILRDDIY